MLSVAALGLGVCAAMAPAQDDYKPSDALKTENSIRPPTQLEGHANAAIEYYRVWDSIPRRDRVAVEEASMDFHPEEPQKLGPKGKEACAKYRAYIDGLIGAANSPDCQWGIRYEAGWQCVVPHLGQLRHSTRVIRMDAYRCIDEKSYAAAAERIAAIIRLSNQMRADEIIISSLVGAAICNLGLELTKDMLKDAQISPASARSILAAIKPLAGEDLFGASAAIRREQQMSVDWSRDHCKGEHAGSFFMQQFGAAGADGRDFLYRFVYSLNEPQLDADLNGFNRYFDAASAAWKRPDNAVLLWELDTEVWEGQYGLAARIMAPSMGNFARSMSRTRADLARVSGQLEDIVRANETPPPAPAKNKGPDH